MTRGCLLILGLLLIVSLGGAPVWAQAIVPDEGIPAATNPGQLFEIHCVGCHPGGGNIIRRGKTLKAKALKRYGYEDIADITAIITHGKGIMSAYEDRLTPTEINALAVYIQEQAETGWN